MIAVLKIMFSAATIAVVGLLESGHCLVGVALVPALLTMWYATRLRAHRRVRERDRA